MCLATSSHSFQYCLKSTNPPMLKWTSRKKKNNNWQLRQKEGLSIFIERCGFLKQQCGPGLFQGLSNSVIPKHKESASHNVVLRKKRSLPLTSSSTEKKTERAVLPLQNGKHSVAHYVASLHPWVVNINGWGKPAVDPLNLIYKEFIGFAGHAWKHSTAVRQTE